jgi:hypothetical protein
MATRIPKDEPTGDRPGNEPDVPVMPTFASLRAQRRPSPVDLLMPEPAARVSRAAARTAPRPPDYADLVRLGVHVAGALAALPVRVTLWAVREPMRLLRRLGRPLGHAPG